MALKKTILYMNERKTISVPDIANAMRLMRRRVYGAQKGIVYE